MPAPDDSPATKADIQMVLARIEALQQMALARIEALQQMALARIEALQVHVSDRFQQVHEYIDERTRDMQTELLRGFATFNNAANIRFLKLEADTSNINSSTSQRLGELEKIVTELRARIMLLESQRPDRPQ